MYKWFTPDNHLLHSHTTISNPIIPPTELVSRSTQTPHSGVGWYAVTYTFSVKENNLDPNWSEPSLNKLTHTNNMEHTRQHVLTRSGTKPNQHLRCAILVCASVSVLQRASCSPWWRALAPTYALWTSKVWCQRPWLTREHLLSGCLYVPNNCETDHILSTPPIILPDTCDFEY